MAKATVKKARTKKAKEEKGMINTHMETIVELPIKRLEPNPYRDFGINPLSSERINELIPSIERDGLYAPVVVRRHPTTKGSYQIVCMHTRVAAAKRMGATTVPAVVLDDCPDSRMLSVMTSENSLQRERPEAVRDSVAAYTKQLIIMLFRSETAEEFSALAETEGLNINLPEKAYIQILASIRSSKLPGWKTIHKIASDLTVSQVQNAITYFKATGLEGQIISDCLKKASEYPDFKERVKAKIKASGINPNELKKEKEKAEAEQRENARKAAEAQLKLLSDSSSDEEKEQAAAELQAAEKAKKTAEQKLRETVKKETEYRNSSDQFLATELLLKQAQAQSVNENILVTTPDALTCAKNEGQIKAIISAFGKDKRGDKRLIPLVEHAAIVKRIVEELEKDGGEITAAGLAAGIADELKARRQEKQEKIEAQLTEEQLAERQQKETQREFKRIAQRIVNATFTLAAEIKNSKIYFKQVSDTPDLLEAFSAKLNGDEMDSEVIRGNLTLLIGDLKSFTSALETAEKQYKDFTAKSEETLVEHTTKEE